MKIATLQERIEKATIKIQKKENTIVKKQNQINKKKIEIEKLGFNYDEIKSTYDELREHKDFRTIYSLLCDIRWLEEDIQRGGKEIEATKNTISKYEKQLSCEIERESILITKIPAVFTTLIDELVETWDTWDKERKQRLREKYKTLGYKGFFEKGYTYSDYKYMGVEDDAIHESNVREAKLLVLDMYNRVYDITGEVTDWGDIRATRGSHGMTVLNGIVVGKEGTATIESILAGGYNIQRLHVRVLVHAY